MKSALVFCLVLFTISFNSLANSSASSSDVNLVVGDSVMINGTKVTCGETRPLHTQSATAKTCARENMKGECVSYSEHTITGNFCMTAQVCGREAMNGKCVYFNTKAECGEGVCTKSKVCAREPLNGECVYYNEAVTCQQR